MNTENIREKGRGIVTQWDVMTFEWENLILVPAFRMQIWHLQFYEYICAAKILQ